MKLKKRISAVMMIVLIAVSTTMVGALPQMPHQFYGDVTINGVAATDGISVEAKIDGVTYATTTTLDGKYGHSPLFRVTADNPDEAGITGGVNGDTVEFYVDGILATPTYTFALGGLKLLNLAITGGAPPTNDDPVADAGGPYSALTDVAINFDGSDSTDSDGTIASYAWVFGDGGTGTGVSPSHTYTTAGSYTVTLTVIDDDAATDSDTAAVTITEEGTPPDDPDDDDDDDEVEPGFTADNIDITNKKKASLGDAGEKGHTIILEGEEDSVASGYEISIYWNIVQDWDGVNGHLNTTDVENDGGFEVWFDVPEAKVGDHNIWFTSTSTSTTARKDFTVIPDLDLSSSSGLADSNVYVDLWGFNKNKDVAILFLEDGLDFMDYGTKVVTDEDLDDSVDGDDEDVDGKVEFGMIEPGTFSITIGGSYVFADTNENGKLYSSGVSSGTINYVSGDWDIDLDDTDATEVGTLDASYHVFEEVDDHFYVLTSSGVTNALGSWEDRRVSIPDMTAGVEGAFSIIGFDGKNTQASAAFNIGATITIDSDEGAVGSIVEVTGEGFKAGDEVRAYLVRGSTEIECLIIDSGTSDIEDGDDYVDSDGEFEMDIVIPSGAKIDDNYEIVIRDTVNEAATGYEITALTTVSVTPDFGPQGSKITVSGENFQNIKNSLVIIELEGSILIKDEVELDADGSFEIKVTVPTENDDSYKITVTAIDDEDDGSFNIDDDVTFRIGTIMVLLSEDETPAGTRIVLTGNGLTDNDEWNATFGEVVIFDDENTVNGLLRMDGSDTPVFYVPMLPAGDYTITVWDVDAEIAIDVDYTITDAMAFEILPDVAPAGYNVTFVGTYWSEDQTDTFEFLVFNDTDEWDITDEVYKVMYDGLGGEDDFKTGDTDGSEAEDGAFSAWWFIGDRDAEDAADVFSMGTYTLNVSYGDDWYSQTLFEVGAVHASIDPRKDSFRISDTVSFDIEHSFGNQVAGDIYGGDVNVYDPNGKLYWGGDPLTEWAESDMYYIAMYADQTASANPMILLDDAPLGTWSYEWRERGTDPDIIANGTFIVEVSATDVVAGMVDGLAADIDSLVDEISALADDIIDYSSEFDSVKDDIAGVADLARAAADAATSAAEAVSSVASVAGDAAEAAELAAEAANDARDAADGLTTLVYGAIGASLVAALAAIVSLMQISRRIAG